MIKVLVVDSDTRHLVQFNNCLTQFGCGVVGVPNVESAMHVIGQCLPDMILISDDNDCPVHRFAKAFFDLWYQFEDQCRRPLVIAYHRERRRTQAQARARRALAYEFGADEYVALPIAPERLLTWCERVKRMVKQGE